MFGLKKVKLIKILKIREDQFQIIIWIQSFKIIFINQTVHGNFLLISHFSLSLSYLSNSICVFIFLNINTFILLLIQFLVSIQFIFLTQLSLYYQLNLSSYYKLSSFFSHSFVLFIMKLSNKQYLVDITLKTIQVKQTKQPSKISCQVHYGDNYLKMKLQPTLKNGIANFYQQRIRIPYASDVALVFKMLKNNKKQVFLGHYPLQLEKSLKQKQFIIQVKGQHLEQTDARVYFDCRIIDKAMFNSDSDEITDDQIVSPNRKQTDFSIQEPKFYRKPMSIKPLSQLDKPFVLIKKTQDLNILQNQQFCNELQTVKDILSKKQAYLDRFKIRQKYSRDQEGFLRSSNILQLQNKLLKLRQEEKVGSFLIYSLLAGVAFVLGFMFA